jgi:hypothetical protein
MRCPEYSQVTHGLLSLGDCSSATSSSLRTIKTELRGAKIDKWALGCWPDGRDSVELPLNTLYQRFRTLTFLAKRRGINKADSSPNPGNQSIDDISMDEWTS